MTNLMFDLPDLKNVKRVVIEKEAFAANKPPKFIRE